MPYRTGARVALALGCALVSALLYLLPNRFGPPPIELPMTALDRAIPFWPASAWTYAAVYLLLPWTFFGIASFTRLVALAKALVFTQAVAALAFTIVPIAYPRGDFPIPPDTRPLDRAVAQFLRDIDLPVNCLPSLHVTTVLLCLAAFDEGRLRRQRPLAIALALATVASTLSFKQHYVVDLVAGAALGAGAWALFLRRAPAAAPHGDASPRLR
ncbi:MAG: phosphatase PAP2 family protein [Lautropia sp.]